MTLRVASAVWSLFGAAVVLFMLAPMVLLVLFSFGKSALTAFPMGGLTLDWYRRLLANDTFWGAAENSAIIAVAVGIISTVIGTMAALRLSQMPERISAPLLLQLRAPVMLPALFVGVALMSFLRLVLDLRLGLPTVILGHLVITQPFVILIVHARMAGFDYALVESARDLGATPLRAFFTVTLPIVRATVVGAALIAVAVSLDDFIITFFTIGSGNTIPTLVWSMVRTSLDPSINASATILIALTMGVTVLALHFSRYRG
ncbi:MAG TPA: ABC transporter permease [Dongiaceae bacterium]